MNQAAIFQPMGTLAFLTLSVLSIVPFRRFAAGRAGLINADKFGESARVPGQVSIPNRNMMNLLELPLLFYVACLMYYMAGKVGGLVLAVAWTYVALRAIHSVIHLTYNNVMHRLIPYAVSNLVLLAFWILFFVR